MSSLGQAFDKESIALPEPAPLPGTVGPNLPFVMAGEKVFPLRNYHILDAINLVHSIED